MDEKRIAARLEENGIPFAPELPGRLAVYFRMLTEWNRSMDLVADAPEDELLDRHLIDSLTVLKTDLLTGAGTLIDVGTGAGFPGMALAMARPDLRVTLLDSQQKRLSFLQAVAEETGTGNTELIHARAEDGARRKDLREQFDIAAARAVAPMNVLCEYLLPLVKVGGAMLALKGPGVDEELAQAESALHLLGGEIERVQPLVIPGRDWDHRAAWITKTAPTPEKYPRRAGTAEKRPL